MSTKIYTGFLIETDSLACLMEKVDAFRPWVIRQAEKKMDDFIRVLVKSGVSASEAWRTWDARRIALRQTMQRDPAVDVEFSLSFFPEPPGGHCLGIVYTAEDAWRRKWLKQPGVHDYSYWDNADKPSRVSGPEWRQREEAWKSVLPDNDPVVMHSFSIDLIGPNNPWPKAMRAKKGKQNEKL